MKQDTKLGHFAVNFRPRAAKYNSTHADFTELSQILN